LISAALAFQKPYEPDHKPVELRSAVQDKNFYLLSMLERNPGAREAVKKSPALARMAAERQAGISRAVNSCSIDLDCNTAAFRWSDAQISEGARALAALYGTSPAIRALADGPLRDSGMYVRYQDLDGAGLLARAWRDCILGINRAIDVYGLGKPPRYAAIDSMTYDAKSDGWRHVVQNLTAVLEDGRASQDLAFSASLRFALELMTMNDRDEAGRFEPMETGENAAAFRRAKSVDWSRYPYTVIVVPGAGNGRPGVRLSP
jgi:hypothetical protein